MMAAAMAPGTVCEAAQWRRSGARCVGLRGSWGPGLGARSVATIGETAQRHGGLALRRPDPSSPRPDLLPLWPDLLRQQQARWGAALAVVEWDAVAHHPPGCGAATPLQEAARAWWGAIPATTTRVRHQRHASQAAAARTRGGSTPSRALPLVWCGLDSELVGTGEGGGAAGLTTAQQVG